MSSASISLIQRNLLIVTLDKNQIKKREVIGDYKNTPVHLVETKGGLSIIFMIKSGTSEAVGVGAHPAVAKYMAEQKEPSINWHGSLVKNEEAQCPTCHAQDTIEECLCVYRWFNEK